MNSMNIYTNQLKIRFNIDAIEEDFAFIRFKRQSKGNWYGAPQLDRLIRKDFMAHAVMFQYGKFAYAMFRKPVDVYKLCSRIRSDEEFEDSAVTEVLPRAFRNDAADSICEAWLAQILLNSLASSRSRFSQYHYCNLTGSLLLVPDFANRKRDYLDIAKIIINPDYLLTVEIIRHRKKISVLSELKKATEEKRRKTLQNALALDKPNYVFQASTGSLRRHLPRDGKIDVNSAYIRSGLYRRKASIPFLDFSGTYGFEKSRAGILHRVLKNIRKHLSKYMEFQLSPLNPDHTVELINSLMKRPKELQGKLDGQPIRIVDRVDTEASLNLLTSLKESISPYLADKSHLTTGKRDKKEALNLRIIHNAAYYEKTEIKDEYLPSTNDIQRQHITVETTEIATDAVAKTILKELLIKRDISAKRLSLFNWSGLSSSRKWTFATCDKKAIRFGFMDIMPDGQFKIRVLDGISLFGYQEYQYYMNLISDAKKNEWKAGIYFEGLVVSENNDINLIFQTSEISLPDLSRIESIIREIDASLPEGMQSGENLAGIVEEFSQEHPEINPEILKGFLTELRKIGKQTISKNEFKSLIHRILGSKNKGTTMEAKTFKSFLLDRYHIRMNLPRDKQSKNELFDASLNIKYFGETDTEAYYYVGNQHESIKFSFKDACHIRKIVAVNGSKLIFKQLLPTMDVDFVRTGQSTVIPFPFKYIREYMNFA